MRLIDKLVLKDLIGPFVNGLLMFMLLVFTAASLFQATDLLVQGVALWTVTKFILFSLPAVVAQTFPMAMLLAGLLGFGRLSADREIIAVFASGVSFPRAARMVFLMGALVSVVAFFWNDWVVPPASTAMWDLKTEAVKQLAKSDRPLKFALESKDGSGSLDGYVYVGGGYDARTQTMRRVTIAKYSRDAKRLDQPEVVVYCDRAVFDKGQRKWLYQDGYSLVYTPDKTTGYIENVMPLYFHELQALPKNVSLGKNFDEMVSSEITDANRKSFGELSREIRDDRQKGRDVEARGKEVDLYGKIALPFASLIFGVVGAALGLNTQRGGGKSVGFGLAIFIVFLYWVFYHSMFVVGKNGAMSPILASFAADIVGAVVGLVLTLRASR